MSIVGLFILSASLIASIWAGKVDLLDAAIVFFIATAVTDVIAVSSTTVKKFLAIKNTEVVMTHAKDNPTMQTMIEQTLRNVGKPKS